MQLTSDDFAPQRLSAGDTSMQTDQLATASKLVTFVKQDPTKRLS